MMWSPRHGLWELRADADSGTQAIFPKRFLVEMLRLEMEKILPRPGHVALKCLPPSGLPRAVVFKQGGL